MPLEHRSAHSPRRRVLHIVWDFSQGGLERFVRELSLSLSGDSFDVHVLSLGQLGDMAAGLEGKVTLHTAPDAGRLSLFRPTALAAQIQRLNPAVVHSHSGVWYKSSRAARLAGIRRIVHTDHGREPGESWLDVALERAAARRTDVVTVVAPWLADYSARRLRIPSSKIKLIPNGVDPSRFSPSRSSTRPGSVPFESSIIGAVGRLVPIKDFDTMLVAFQRLRLGDPSMTSVHLVIIGDGPCRAALQAKAESLGLGRSVTFAGWDRDVERYLPWFDIFSLSSRSEGTSISLLEAMSAGVCPIVTAVGGNPDVLGPELQHRLVPSGDATALAAAWADALRHPRKRAEDAVSARNRVKSSFSWDATVRAYRDIYNALCATESQVPEQPA